MLVGICKRALRHQPLRTFIFQIHIYLSVNTIGYVAYGKSSVFAIMSWFESFTMLMCAGNIPTILKFPVSVYLKPVYVVSKQGKGEITSRSRYNLLWDLMWCLRPTVVTNKYDDQFQFGDLKAKYIGDRKKPTYPYLDIHHYCCLN